MPQNNEPALLTDNPLVNQFYDNTQSNIIRINDDKLKVILYENKETISNNQNFLTPLSLLITFILTYCTTDFKKFLEIPATTWEGFYFFCCLASIVWLFVELKKIKKNITLDQLIDKIKNPTNTRNNPE
jgi:hypothetical protein